MNALTPVTQNWNKKWSQIVIVLEIIDTEIPRTEQKQRKNSRTMYGIS